MTLLNSSTMSDSLVLFPSDDEDSEANYETKQYDNFSGLLKGVPPPSSITIAKFTVDEMLQKYKENKDTYGFGTKLHNSDEPYGTRNPAHFLKYMNSSQLSEKIASLMQKVQERYIQLETMSSCNIWFEATLQTCGSAKKRLRMRYAMGMSPGRRLSHLARRRQFFSSANLKLLANTDNIRQIEIRRKDGFRGERKKMNRTVEFDKLNSSKRALFQSPENGTPTKYGRTVRLERKIYSSDSEEKRKLPLQEKSKVLKWLNQQNFESELPRKRLREECANLSNDRKRRCPRRSLNFADEEVCKSETSSVTSSNSEKKAVGAVGRMSESHKNKLLWAVSVVLKESNINRNDENFKSCASALFHLCRKNLDEILNSEVASGTSDKILIYARRKIPDLLKDLGIQPVISKKIANVENNQENMEAKENINQNSVKAGGDSKDPASGFVFKTPMKVCRKRTVKSCQKESPKLVRKKKKVIRRCHSLESLIESETVLVERLNGAENVLCGNRIEGPRILPCSTPHNPVIFSPIPSSVNGDSGSKTVLYPALCENTEQDILSDSFSSETEDGKEILNQDAELELGLKIFTTSEENKTERACEPEEQYGSISLNVEESSLTDNGTERTTIRESKNTEEAKLMEQGMTLEAVDLSYPIVEEAEVARQEVEEGTYKPRKLVVKKSKPNWKVVRKDSEESDTDELRLKMRLSHEWEIVARNSSCSDIGNNSECEGNSSQISNSNGEKDLCSEVEESVHNTMEFDTLPSVKQLNAKLQLSAGKNFYDSQATVEEYRPENTYDFEKAEDILSSTLIMTEGAENEESGKNWEEATYSPISRIKEDEGKGSTPNDSPEDDSSKCSEQKKRSLTLENYKARKLQEASEEKISAETSSFDCEGNKIRKKIYHIRLKHPTGTHSRKDKHKLKRKFSYSNEEVDETVELDCGNDQVPENDLGNGTEAAAEPEGRGIPAQTIADNLSKLSSLVEQEMRVSNDLKKIEWLSDVSAWCRTNMNNLKNQFLGTVEDPSTSEPSSKEIQQAGCSSGNNEELSDVHTVVATEGQCILNVDPGRLHSNFNYTNEQISELKDPLENQQKIFTNNYCTLSGYIPNQLEYSHVYTNSYPPLEEPIVYLPNNMYNYQSWQYPPAWNLQQNTTDGFVFPNYIPCQMSSVPYYYTNY